MISDLDDGAMKQQNEGRSTTSTTQFLLTNDDGIDAPGLEALETVIQSLGAEYMVLAPHQPLSGCSHQVTVHRPLKLTRHGPKRFALDGSPADCVRFGLRQLAPATTCVLSGINDGGNLGVDIYMSGTVAAAREAASQGILAVAFSQYRKRPTRTTWESSATQVRRLLTLLMERPREDGHFWNVNFPDQETPQPPIVDCPLDPSPLIVDFEEQEGLFHVRGDYQQRPWREGGDIEACFSGAISVTRLHVSPGPQLPL